MPISCSPEHKIAIFVRFCPSKPLFSGLSSTKRAFLCQKGQLFPGFTPSRAQNRGFCAFLAFGTAVFGRFEHKIEVFVSERATFPRFYPLLSTKLRFLVSVSAITCHQYKESRVSGPAILSSICLGGDLGMLRSLNREAKRLFC